MLQNTDSLMDLLKFLLNWTKLALETYLQQFHMNSLQNQREKNHQICVLPGEE